MIAALESHPDSAPPTPRHRIVAVLTVIGWLALAALVGASYVGHSPGPYGVCYAPNGHSVPCAAVVRH
jgi:hypothetical protein